MPPSALGKLFAGFSPNIQHPLMTQFSDTLFDKFTAVIDWVSSVESATFRITCAVGLVAILLILKKYIHAYSEPSSPPLRALAKVLVPASSPWPSSYQRIAVEARTSLSNVINIHTASLFRDMSSGLVTFREPVCWEFWRTGVTTMNGWKICLNLDWETRLKLLKFCLKSQWENLPFPIEADAIAPQHDPPPVQRYNQTPCESSVTPQYTLDTVQWKLLQSVLRYIRAQHHRGSYFRLVFTATREHQRVRSLHELILSSDEAAALHMLPFLLSSQWNPNTMSQYPGSLADAISAITHQLPEDLNSPSSRFVVVNLRDISKSHQEDILGSFNNSEQSGFQFFVAKWIASLFETEGPFGRYQVLLRCQ